MNAGCELAKKRWAKLGAAARRAALAPARDAAREAREADPETHREAQRARARLPRKKRSKQD